MKINDQYQSENVILESKKKISPFANLYRFKFCDERKKISFLPGQFVQLSFPGYGEAPFSVASKTAEPSATFELAVQDVGLLTKHLSQSRKNTILGVRGPYGSGWPLKKIEGRNLIIVAGGCGLAPFRALVYYLIQKNCARQIQLLYGARDNNNMFFKKEYSEWGKKIKLHFALDKVESDVKGCLALNQGLVTKLLEDGRVNRDAVVFVCGPPLMSKFVTLKLLELGYKDKDIYLSLERRMDCAVGICQHCAIGSYYVCKDGPVFSYQFLKKIPGVVEVGT